MDFIIKSPNPSFILIFSLFLLVSCASFNPFSGNSGSVSKKIGTEGGSITSADGKVTLDFPAGALSKTEIITVEKIDTELLGPDFDEVRTLFNIDSAYELSPDGLTFDAPVYTTMISDQKTETPEGHTELKAEIFFSSSGGILKVLENQGIRRSVDSKVTVYGELSSFSKLVKAEDTGTSVKSVTGEEIENLPVRSVQSVVTLVPNLNLGTNQPTITQSYQAPLDFLDVTQISQISTTTGDHNQFTRTFNYTCFADGPALLITNTKFAFPNSMSINVLRNSTFNFQNNQLVDCFFPENSEPEYNFDISDPSGKFSSDIAGEFTLSIPFNIDEEIADNFFFQINWGDGNENIYEPSAMETTRGQRGPSGVWDFEDTHIFEVSHQYTRGNSYDIQVEGWAYDAPRGTEEDDTYESLNLNFNRRLANRWMQRGHFTSNDWEWDLPSSAEKIFEPNSIPQLSNWPLGQGNFSSATEDGHLQFDFSGLNQFDDAYPLFSVDRVDLGKNSWAYYLNYPLDFSNGYNISPSIRYNEFPQSNDSQPIQLDFNLEQIDPIVIQVNESNNPVFFNDFNSFDPNLPTRYIITPVLSENLKLYDIEETQVIIPENTLTIRTRGTGNGTIYGRVINSSGSSDVNSNDGFTSEWTTQSDIDSQSLQEMFSAQNGDYFNCNDVCELLFPENTEIEVFPRATFGSTFIGIENNSEREENGTYRFKMTGDIDLTAFFDDPEQDDDDPDDSPETFMDEPIQTRTTSGARIFGSSYKVGAKLDWATRSSFKDAVCAQQGLMDCTVDGLSPVLVLFGETSLFNWNLTEHGIGIVPISFGASLSLSQVDFEQNYTYGIASPLPYDVSGETGILGIDTYIRAHRTFDPILNLPGRPVLSPYINVGMSNLWNCTDFKFISEDETFDYHREHHGVHFIGGFGADVNFRGPWGARVNLDYTAGGADANLRFGAGVTYRFGSRLTY